MADAFDIDYPRLAVIVVLVVVNLALVGALATSGAAYGPYNSEWDGASTLRETADRTSDVRVAIGPEGYDGVQANTSLAIVLTPSPPVSDQVATIHGFLSRGGTLVVAGQNASRTNAYLQAIGARARVDGRPLRDEQNSYRGGSLPVAGNVTDHPLTDGVESLTLNNGTVVRPHNTTHLINTSSIAYLDTNENGALDDGEPLGPFSVATAESVGNGRIVVVSDPSVFTNAMLDREGNRAFLDALLDGRSDVILDYSQDASLPALVYALLAVRASPILQTVIGTTAFAALALWLSRDRILEVLAPIRARLPLLPSDESGRPDVDLDEDAIAALLADRHPEWDEDRIERVTEAILRQRETQEQ